tara:strand:+ start:481 stop:702 length:222 start_codon:yes stop_codon:yes gene_type:complete
MKSTQVLKELQQLRKEWRLNNFHFTSEQKKRYDELTLERREIVKDWYANDKVWIGPSNIKLTTKEGKKDDKKD